MGLIGIKDLVNRARVFWPFLRKNPFIASGVGLVLMVLIFMKGPGLITTVLGTGGEDKKPQPSGYEQTITELRAHITAEREAYQALLATYTQETMRLTTELAKAATGHNESSSRPVVASWHINVISPLKVRQAQIQLKALGFKPGPIDGLYGQQTRAALYRYQAAQALLPILDAKPEAQTLAHAQALSDVSAH